MMQNPMNPGMQRPMMGAMGDDDMGLDLTGLKGPGSMNMGSGAIGQAGRGPQSVLPGQFDAGGLQDLPGGPDMASMGIKPQSAQQAPRPGFWDKFGGGLGGLLSGGAQGAMQGWKGVNSTPPPPGSTPMWTAMLNKGLGRL